MAHNQTQPHDVYVAHNGEKPMAKIITVNTSISNQRGATLIVVLLMLVLISLAGVMAVNQSRTDLKLATSDQINTLLLQSADSANQQLESVINGDPTDKVYKDMLSQAGIFGYYILDKKSQKNEYVYCFNTESGRYLRKNASIMLPSSGTIQASGFCDVTTQEGFTSSREAVATQVNITIPRGDDAEPFSSVSEGKNVDSNSSIKYTFDIRTTSAIPSYGSSSESIKTCFENRTNKNIAENLNELTLSQCLGNAQVPKMSLNQRTILENITSPTMCVPFGKDSTSSEDKCALKPKT